MIILTQHWEFKGLKLRRHTSETSAGAQPPWSGSSHDPSRLHSKFEELKACATLTLPPLAHHYHLHHAAVPHKCHTNLLVLELKRTYTPHSQP